MSAIVCGKRSFFEDLQSPSPTSASPPISKKLRCSSTSPIRLPSSSPPPLQMAVIDQLRALFPDMNSQLLEKALEECGNDLDAAITRLHGLHVRYAEENSTASEADGEMDSEWVELFVREMMSATSIDDARARASRVLESLEKSISAGSAEAAQNFQKENMILKEQIEMILRDNAILKRAVAIQHERQKEYDVRNEEAQHLKRLIVQYQEELRTLEVNNYAMKMHLQQAQQRNSIPGRFHPDVF
ncbi:uncharacterized protein LOC107808852 isoform X2 [Nicotiana tabacum]|uniref:Uncharacterized protein LOC107808852 isoform X2 n=1 Tax=Nicotiana tabacum TaxID=4097 RepID=A0A1S4BJ86_TOBAC|nr:PREDICTED: uncharacterized protein LOC107808852 isoform X2 [Nicotiana tabacum]